MTAAYITPGMPAPALPAAQPNSYLQPSGPPPQSMPPPTPPPEPTHPQARDQDPHCGTLISEWRCRHGSEWVRADDLAPTVCRMVDPQERTAAVRQRLRQLVAHTPELQVKVVGNAARPVAFYRVTESQPA